MTDEPIVAEPDISEAEAEHRLRADRFDAVALVAKGDHCYRAGNHRAAQSFYSAATRTPPPRDQLAEEHAHRMVAWLGELFKRHLLNALNDVGFSENHRHPRFQKSLEMMLGQRERPAAYQRFPQMPMLYYYPDLAYTQFAETGEFDWAKKVESCFPAMREEALALLGDAADFRPYVTMNTERPQGDVHGLLNNPDWSTYFLFENGEPVSAHVERCPAIFEAVIQNVPLCRIGPRAPSIMLSLLRPHSRIPAHTGMLNCRYICHLPLVIPPDCGFRVGEVTREWREGELLSFDDTVEHEAWNNSDQSRLVLIFDVWRPELSKDEQEMVQALFAAVDSY